MEIGIGIIEAYLRLAYNLLIRYSCKYWKSFKM